MPRQTRVVVLGGGLAGVLAASALAGFADTITIVERDRLPDEPVSRAGLPQARHAHILWSGGARAIDRLLPGATDELISRGAHRVGVPSDIVFLTAHGWIPRTSQAQFIISCTRDLLDWTLRNLALRDPRITLQDNAQVIGLTGDATHVTGARIQDRGSQTVSHIDADFVVDATGRGSRAKQWLTELGLPGIETVREAAIDSGLVYVTRTFRAPEAAARNFPMVSVQPDVPTRGPGQSATLLPIEHGRWMVTLAGTRGGEPPNDESHFVDFARATVRHPIVADLIRALTPVTPIYSSRSTANRRLYYERLSRWPDNFVVLGDALATYNPIYGHGMSIAAHNCLALHAALQSHGLTATNGRQLQRRIARTVQAAWDMATSVDLFYPNAAPTRPTSLDKAKLRYVNRVIRAATDDPAIATALFDAFSLSTPPTRLAEPKVLLGASRPRRATPPSEPPITSDELRRADQSGRAHPSA